jgi:hypothetical protein
MILIDHSMGVRSVGLDALAHGKKFWRALVWLAGTMISTSRGGPTPTPTCPPRARWKRDMRMWPLRRQRSGRSVGPPVKRRVFCFQNLIIDPLAPSRPTWRRSTARMAEPSFTLRVGRGLLDLALRPQAAPRLTAAPSSRPATHSASPSTKPPTRHDRPPWPRNSRGAASPVSRASASTRPIAGPAKTSFLVFGLTLEAAKVLGDTAGAERLRLERARCGSAVDLAEMNQGNGQPA